MIKISINGKEYEVSENISLNEIAYNYGGILDGDSYFAKVNGKTINSLIDDIVIEIKDNDVIEIFPLVLGG